MDPGRILIVEDEAIVALDLKLQLQDLGYEVVGVAASGEQAVAAASRLAPQLILMDVRLQGPMDGVDAARIIGKQHGVPVIYLTSHSDADTVRRAAQTGPYGYLTKPYQIKELHAGVEVALTKSRMERQLREADRWFAHTLHCVSDAVIVTDLQARVKFMNPAAEALTGWASEDAMSGDVAEVVRLRDRDDPGASLPTSQVSRSVFDVLREGRPQPVAHAQVLVARDGVLRFVDQTAGVVEDESGRRLGAVLVLRDAGARLKQEERLRASEARFRDAFDHAPLGMALVAFDGTFLQVNGALCKLLGRTREQLKSLHHGHLTVAADREHERQRLRELNEGPARVVQFEKRYHRVPETQLQKPSELSDWVCVLVSVSLLHDASAPTCYLYQVHDLTQDKIAAERVAELADERLRREASEMANASKDSFLSRVSHEMRTPLNAVLGFSQLLKLQAADKNLANVVRYADLIQGAGQHLLGLVTDLLDLNRAVQGTLKLALEPVRLADSVADTLRLIEAQALAQQVKFELAVPPELAVMADPRRLLQVLLNLGSNAVKYNRIGGSVVWRAEVAELPADAGPDRGPGQVMLKVQDSGMGIAPAQLERLFQPFERLGAENTQVPGTGLGLVISRSLVAEMGGTLAVQSTLGQGTRVTVTLNRAG